MTVMTLGADRRNEDFVTIENTYYPWVHEIVDCYLKVDLDEM